MYDLAPLAQAAGPAHVYHLFNAGFHYKSDSHLRPLLFYPFAVSCARHQGSHMKTAIPAGFKTFVEDGIKV